MNSEQWFFNALRKNEEKLAWTHSLSYTFTLKLNYSFVRSFFFSPLPEPRLLAFFFFIKLYWKIYPIFHLIKKKSSAFDGIAGKMCFWWFWVRGIDREMIKTIGCHSIVLGHCVIILKNWTIRRGRRERTSPLTYGHQFSSLYVNFVNMLNFIDCVNSCVFN